MLLVNRLLEQGELKGKIETAFKLLNKGMSLDDISDAVGLNIYTLEKLCYDKDVMTLDDAVEYYMSEQKIVF